MSENSSFLEQRNNAFREVHPAGSTHEETFFTVDDPNGVAFKATHGKTLADVQKDNEQAVNRLFEPDEIGSVFEEPKKPEEKALSNEIKPTSNNGIDPKDIDALKKELSDQEKNIKGPVEPSLNFVK